jgi:hypothetical protein
VTADGFFFDCEEAGTSTFGAYVPGLWEQTSQADFENGMGDGVAVSPAGDVALAAGGGSFMLFWEGDAVPENWTSVSDEGEEYYHRFPRGAAEYGGEGGTENHTHTGDAACSGPSHTITQKWSSWNWNETECASPAHTHTGTATVANASHLPLHRDFKVIRYDGGVPCIIPAGAIGIFEDLPAGDWEQAYGDGRYLRGGAAAGTGGAQNHTHEVTATTGAASEAVTIHVRWLFDGTEIKIAGPDHTHNVTTTTAAAENEPPFITVKLGRAENDTVVPPGLIAMHDGKRGEGWSVVSDFEGNLIRDTGTYGEIGGTESHNHSDMTIKTDGPTPIEQKEIEKGNKGSEKIAHPTHTHTLDLSFDTATSLPPYRDTIFARAEYPLEGTLESVVFDTGIEGATWNAFFWDGTTEGGMTAITMAVRASDTPFHQGDASPAWTDPADGLPPGRYMQWKATLTTTDSTKTPVLHAVRAYYY